MTIPPDVVRILASSTVFVNASSRVNLDFAGMTTYPWLLNSVLEQSGPPARASLVGFICQAVVADRSSTIQRRATVREGTVSGINKINQSP